MPTTKTTKKRSNPTSSSKFAIDPKTGIMQYTGKVPSKTAILNSLKGDKSREAQIIRSTYKKSK